MENNKKLRTIKLSSLPTHGSRNGVIQILYYSDVETGRGLSQCDSERQEALSGRPGQRCRACILAAANLTSSPSTNRRSLLASVTFRTSCLFSSESRMISTGL